MMINEKAGLRAASSLSALMICIKLKQRPHVCTCLYFKQQGVKKDACGLPRRALTEC